MLIIFFVQLLLADLFQGTFFPFWAGCRMRLLRDVNRKPRDLLWQPGSKYIRAFPFPWTLALLLNEGLVLLHPCWAPPFRAFRYLCSQGRCPVPVQVWGPLLSPCQVWVLFVSVAGVLQTGSCVLVTVHRRDSSVRELIEVIFKFFFIPLCLLRLWLQPPWSWNMANIKSGWWIYWMRSDGHLVVVKAALGREEMSSAEKRSEISW